MYKYNKISTDRIEYQMTGRNIKIVWIGIDNQISMIHPEQIRYDITNQQPL